MDVQGLGSEKTLKQLGEAFELHPLLLEDVVNVPQRPKVKDYNEQLLIIAQMVLPKSNEEGFDSEQIGFVIGKKYLLTSSKSLNTTALIECAIAFAPTGVEFANQAQIISLIPSWMR